MARKILIVEDNESYSSILCQKFTQEEFEVISAKDGHEGLQKATDSRPDIILIDLLLPIMNGLQLMEELRKNEWGKQVPLLILTNLNPNDEIQQSITRNRPAHYLIKPEVTIDEIVDKIRSVLQTPR